jgi:flagellar motor switch protein FliG
VDDGGVNDSALLLLSIGEEAAAEVMKHLAPKEVQKVVEAMARVQGVTREKIETVLSNFHEAAATRTAIGGSDGYVRSVLTRALGEERATYLLDRILGGADASGIENLKWMDAQSVAELIRSEHPQIIASILAYLDRDQASEVLLQLPDKLRGDVVLRIATLDAIQPNAMRELNDVLAKLLSGGAPAKKASPGGVRAAADILNYMGATNETAVIEAVREHDADLAQKIVDEMFVFENLLDVDDRGIQALLREVQSESLIVALKGANEELRDKIFRNMSQRAAEMLRDDLDAKGPVRVSEVETEQKEILKIVRRMAEEGTIAIGGRGDDEFV